MRVGIHQPMYLPWLGLFDRIHRCDIFVLLDNVPYSKNYFLNRNKIKIKDGFAWLTVPVLTKGNFGQLIKDVEIDNTNNWKERHWKSIYFSYKKAPHFLSYGGFFESIYNRDWTKLTELNEELINYILETLHIKTPVIRASTLNIDGKKEGLILNICKKLNADEYLSGPDGRNYLNMELWEKNGIKVMLHEYRHPQYSQLYGEFLPNMSIIDLLFNCGEDSLNILTNKQIIEERDAY